MLKLPESERDALSVVERDFASLKRSLDQTEAKGVELMTENNELKQVGECIISFLGENFTTFFTRRLNTIKL